MAQNKSQKKMTEEDKKYWNKILEFVEKEIFNYDDNQHIQKMAVLKLKGLLSGKVVANSRTQNNGNYSYKVIYATFLACKNKIMNAIRNKTFNDEAGKVGYVCAIVRNNINSTYEILKKKQIVENNIKNKEVDDEIGHTGVNYDDVISNSDTNRENRHENKTKKYEGLW